MAITEFAILIFTPSHSLSDPVVRSLFQKLSIEQSQCSGFQLLFFTSPDDSSEVHLITGWNSVAAHEAWIKGKQNQELLSMFAPYIDMQKISMVHLDIDFKRIPEDVGMMVIQRYGEGTSGLVGEGACSNDSTWPRVGRDLAESGGDIYHFSNDIEEVGGAGKGSGPGTLVARWKLRRVEVVIQD
ncbi:hypothetical protein PAXRUDRAFT_824869 [Paxillus rubicundulus Ve08.2h10]|uniref:ABM domain-containing protein n=1 Tax=Paxillus rubicundulus Ve08.2h10 TaxID=930991 RepID=A0A0D0EBE5_9AGAM|nr:hypothetical protein PAXRUDRAFT_824869 [Paxillus rubicundulus Ve08.2h10]